MSDTTADEIKAAQHARREAKRAAESTQRTEAESGDKVSMKGSSMSSDIYGEGGSRFANHDLSIAVGGGGDDDMDDEGNAAPVRLLDSCEPARPRPAAARTLLTGRAPQSRRRNTC